jgi:hypothetical protein
MLSGISSVSSRTLRSLPQSNVGANFTFSGIERVSAILLPKVSDVSFINKTANHISVKRGQNLGCSKSATRLMPDLWAMMETTKGIINCETIAASHYVKALVSIRFRSSRSAPSKLSTFAGIREQ